MILVILDNLCKFFLLLFKKKKVLSNLVIRKKIKKRYKGFFRVLLISVLLLKVVLVKLYDLWGWRFIENLVNVM